MQLVTDLAWAVKAASDLGVVGILMVALVMAYRLINKWGGEFLAASTAQTKAMADQASAVANLASVVKDGQTDQREVLIAVRVQSAAMEEMKGYLRELNDRLVAKEIG